LILSLSTYQRILDNPPKIGRKKKITIIGILFKRIGKKIKRLKSKRKEPLKAALKSDP